MQVAIITGEASGDRVGGQLAHEIRRLRPEAALWGTGGQHLRAAGAQVLWDASRWGMVGAAAALRILPRLLRVRQALMRELLRRKPDVLVPVDAGAFHLGFGPIEGLCPWARRHLPDTRILYYFPPGSWRRTLRATSLTGNVDKVATPFPWSETELRRLGVDATFVGHPLLDLVHASEPTQTFAARYGLDLARPVVGLLPGSRSQEIRLLLPVQLEAAARIHRRVPGVQFLLGLASTVDRAEVVRWLERQVPWNVVVSDVTKPKKENVHEDPLKRVQPALVTTEGALVPPDKLPRDRDWIKRVEGHRGDATVPLAIVENATYDMMAASDVLLVTSGTATLEATILNKPMVIAYRLSLLNAPEYWLVKNKLPPHIGMPNLLLERRACPEFVQNEATGANLANAVISLLLEPERLLGMKRDLKEATALLGEPGGAGRAARMVVDLAQG